MAQGLCAIFLVKIPYAWYATFQESPRLFNIGLSTAFAAAFTLLACLVYYMYVRKKDMAPEHEIAVS